MANADCKAQRHAWRSVLRVPIDHLQATLTHARAV
jgi:hypothetical protein